MDNCMSPIRNTDGIIADLKELSLKLTADEGHLLTEARKKIEGAEKVAAFYKRQNAYLSRELARTRGNTEYFRMLGEAELTDPDAAARVRKP